ncbi:glycosyltransferase family 8 protein [bacterium]|nr:glycosyltransferase family 8 protein [bacterium]
MNNQTIPILFASDDNYVKYLYVAILSLLKNKNFSTLYDFFILCPQKYDKQIINDFDNLKEIYDGINFHYIEMGNAFDNAEDTKRILPSPTYYYLKLADIIPDYDKAIYLDPDIIVLDDLSEFFNTDLKDNYVAGVKAAGYMCENYDKEYFDKIGIYDIKQYINANSLLFNLALMRKDNVTEKFCELSKNIYRSMDQDVLNIVCQNKIVHMPLKYNLMVKYFPYENNPNWSYDLLKDVYGEQNLLDAKNSPVIIHYANVGEKPWCFDTELKNFWWEYAKLSPYYKEFLFEYFSNYKIKKIVHSFLKKIFSINKIIDHVNNIKTKEVCVLGFKMKFSKNLKEE